MLHTHTLHMVRYSEYQKYNYRNSSTMVKLLYTFELPLKLPHKNNNKHIFSLSSSGILTGRFGLICPGFVLT